MWRTRSPAVSRSIPARSSNEGESRRSAMQCLSNFQHRSGPTNSLNQALLKIRSSCCPARRRLARRTRPPNAAAGRTQCRTGPAGAARGGSSQSGLCADGLASLRPLLERRQPGPSAAGCDQGQGGGEVRGDQQRRHVVSRGYRTWLQRWPDHRILFPRRPRESPRLRHTPRICPS
jgi:hypothetical protein